MDFTLRTYHEMLFSLKQNGYAFYTFEQFLSIPHEGKMVVLRHDIDKRSQNALLLAQIETEMDIHASYYTRVVKRTWDETVIKQLVQMGHEVSYHYEDLAIANGNYEKAWEHFKYHLSQIRRIYPAKTICMHGSPLSKWDNRKLWDKYDYRKEGIIGEPYFDIDYSKVLYITDTGRGWNNTKASVRDKINNSNALHLKINDTNHLIRMIKQGELPDCIMINTHPQRWFPVGIKWLCELLLQSIKNIVKRGLIFIRP